MLYYYTIKTTITIIIIINEHMYVCDQHDHLFDAPSDIHEPEHRFWNFCCYDL